MWILIVIFFPLLRLGIDILMLVHLLYIEICIWTDYTVICCADNFQVVVDYSFLSMYVDFYWLSVSGFGS